jgi:ABC-type branched-subunit amino acid transport system permease subunit
MTRRAAVPAAAAILVAALPLGMQSPYFLHVAIIACIYVVLAQSLNLVLGYSGLLSLATPAFFGIGAYVAALLALRSGWDGSATFPLAALAGALYAHFITYIDPGVFGFSVTEALLIMVILGGAGTLWGPVAGAVVFTVLPEVLRLTPEIRSLLYGGILLTIVLYRPRRLLG